MIGAPSASNLFIASAVATLPTALTAQGVPQAKGAPPPPNSDTRFVSLCFFTISIREREAEAARPLVTTSHSHFWYREGQRGITARWQALPLSIVPLTAFGGTEFCI